MVNIPTPLVTGIGISEMPQNVCYARNDVRMSPGHFLDVPVCQASPSKVPGVSFCGEDSILNRFPKKS